MGVVLTILYILLFLASALGLWTFTAISQTGVVGSLAGLHFAASVGTGAMLIATIWSSVYAVSSGGKRASRALVLAGNLLICPIIAVATFVIGYLIEGVI